MRVLLLQLPVQGHDFFYSNENLPAAVALLQTIGLKQGVEVELLPGPLMSYGSDQAILKYLVDAHPDVVGMSSYLWNIERNLYLAGKLKEQLPNCSVVLGGPEITPENDSLLQHKNFDIGVVGEGENAWQAILQSFPRVPDIAGLLRAGDDGSWRFTGVNRTWVSLRTLPSPYLSGCLDPYLKKVLWLETVRGCTYRCAYCYYHKQFPRLRSFPLERIEKEIRRALDRGLNEIVFLDPNFTRHPRLRDLLDAFSTINSDQRLHLHGECNVEDIDPVVARKMSRAGFDQLEVGLQSTNPSALRCIHRRFQPQRFIEGAKHLKKHHIQVMVDIIAGLPGDTLTDMRRSIDWVLEQDVYDFLMVYPLALLPSTELRQRAQELGLVAMSEPPYYLTRSREVGAEEMVEAFRYYSQSMGEDICPLEMPSHLDPTPKTIPLPKELQHVIVWHHPEEVRSLSRTWDRTAYALTVSLSQEVLRRPELWSPILRDYLNQNPFTLLSIEVPPDLFPEELVHLWSLAREHHHPIDRDYTVTHTPYRSFLVLSRSQNLIWNWPDPREACPIALPDGQRVSSCPTLCVAGPETGIPEWLKNHMSKRYKPLPEMILWEPPEDN